MYREREKARDVDIDIDIDVTFRSAQVRAYDDRA